MSPPDSPSTRQSATPHATTIYTGSLKGGDYRRLAADDNAFYEVSSTTCARIADWYARIGGVANGLGSLQITYSGKASETCDQSLYVDNWTTGVWVALDARAVGTTEIPTVTSVGGTLADYVSGATGDGEVAVRIRCTRADAKNVATRGDLLRVTFTK